MCGNQPKTSLACNDDGKTSEQKNNKAVGKQSTASDLKDKKSKNDKSDNEKVTNTEAIDRILALKQEVKDLIMKLPLEEEYLEACCNVFMPGEYSTGVLKKMVADLKAGVFLKRASSYYRHDTIEPSYAAVAELAQADASTGYDPVKAENCPRFTRFRTREVVLQGSPWRRSGLFSGNGIPLPPEQAAHEHCNRLKNVVAAWLCLPENDFYAVSIANTKYLNHDGNGALVLTGCYDTHVLMLHLETMMAKKLPFVGVVRSFTQGFILTDEYCYYCDPLGQVRGTCRGSNYIYRDLSDPFPAYGSYKDYQVSTLGIYGPERIILMTPGGHPTQQKKLNMVKEDTYPCKGYLAEALTKVGMVGLHDVIPEEENVTPGDITITSSRLLEEYVPMNNVQRIYDYLATPARYLPILLPTALSAILMAIGSSMLTPEDPRRPNQWQGIDVEKYGRLCIHAGLAIIGIALSYQWIKYKFLTVSVSLGVVPLHFRGKYAEDLWEFYIHNPIDSRGLPYGYYKTTRFSIIQVGQRGDGATWTNVPELILRYCDSRGFADTSAPQIYNLSLDASTPLITKGSSNSFHPQMPTALRRITCSAPYRIKIDEKTVHTAIKLLPDNRYREFVVGEISAKGLMATAGNRMLAQQFVSQVTAEQFRDEIRSFWDYYRGGTVPPLDLKPDLTNFKGAKRNAYEKILEKIALVNWLPNYQSFPKVEALPLPTLMKKAVRLIVMNSKAFNIMFKNFFKWFEETLLSFSDKHGPIFGKGLNAHDTWDTIMRLITVYQYVISIDFKKFDSTHRDANYRGEMLFFAYLGLPLWVAELLAKAGVNGVIRHFVPMRHSGDLFTGSGNCLVVASLLHAFKREIRYLCNGDDTLIFTNDPQIINRIQEYCNIRGYVIEADDAIMTYTTKGGRQIPLEVAVEYCHMTYTRDGYSFDVHRMINRAANITASNRQHAAKIVLGKVTSLPILESAGVDFGFKVATFIRDTDDDGSNKYLRAFFSVMPLLKVDENITKLDITNGQHAGILADVVNALRARHFLLRYLNDVHWRRYALRIISNVLEKHEKDQKSFTDDYYVKTKRLNRIVKELDISSLQPLMHKFYQEMFIERFHLHPIYHGSPPPPLTTTTTGSTIISIRKGNKAGYARIDTTKFGSKRDVKFVAAKQVPLRPWWKHIFLIPLVMALTVLTVACACVVVIHIIPRILACTYFNLPRFIARLFRTVFHFYQAFFALLTMLAR